MSALRLRIIRRLFGLGYIDEWIAVINRKVNQLDQDRCLIEKDVRANAETKLMDILRQINDLYVEIKQLKTELKRRKK